MGFQEPNQKVKNVSEIDKKVVSMQNSLMELK
jgi:hypothetical protein